MEPDRMQKVIKARHALDSNGRWKRFWENNTPAKMTTFFVHSLGRRLSQTSADNLMLLEKYESPDGSPWKFMDAVLSLGSLRPEFYPAGKILMNSLWQCADAISCFTDFDIPRGFPTGFTQFKIWLSLERPCFQRPKLLPYFEFSWRGADWICTL